MSPRRVAATREVERLRRGGSGAGRPKRRMTLMLWTGVGLGAAVGLLAAVELAVRWHFRRRSRSYAFFPNSTVVYHPDPAASAYLDPVTERRINELGERGGPLPKGPGRVLRGLVLGGSAAECLLLDQPKTWPAVLESLLQRAADEGRLPAGRVHVGNVARAMVNAQGLLRMARRLLPERERLEWIFVMTGYPVVLRWLNHGAELDAAIPPYDDDDLFAVSPDFGFGWGLKGSATRKALAFWKHRRRPRVVREAGQFLLRNRRMRAAATDFVSLPNVAESRYFAESCEHLRALIRLCRRHAERVIVIGQGWIELEGLSPEQQRLLWFGRVGEGPEWRFASTQSLTEAYEAVHRATLALAREEGAETIDGRAVVPGEFGMFYDDGHYANAGAKVLAEALAAHVLGEPSA